MSFPSAVPIRLLNWKDAFILSRRTTLVLTSGKGNQANRCIRFACELYKNLWDYSLKASLPSLLQYVWYDLGYRCFYLQRPKYHAYLDHYDYLYRLAEVQQESGASLVSFLDVVRSHLGSGDKMDEGADKVLTEAKDGVQIMSIHESHHRGW